MYLTNDYPDVQMTIVWLVSLKNKHNNHQMLFFFSEMSNESVNQFIIIVEQPILTV